MNEVNKKATELLQKITRSSVELPLFTNSFDPKLLYNVLSAAVNHVSLYENEDSYFEHVVESFVQTTGASKEFWIPILSQVKPGDLRCLMGVFDAIKGKAGLLTPEQKQQFSLTIPIGSASIEDFYEWVDKAPFSFDIKEMVRSQLGKYVTMVETEEFGEMMKENGYRSEYIKEVLRRAETLGISIRDLTKLFDFVVADFK